ncbi:MAG: hypothetical protein ACW99Q_25550 [Candidatus Kariarchaeaceae archaeon]|jgi:hypothetical protein
MTDRPNFYDQSNIPQEVFDKMKELKEIEDKLNDYQRLIDRKNEILDEITKTFPQESNAIAVQDGLVLSWKLGNRQIGNVDLKALEDMSPFLVRTIPEKVTPEQRKAQTLTKIEEWMESVGLEDRDREEIYLMLDIKQSKSLKSERI